MTDPPELAVPDVLEPGARIVLRSIPLFPTATSHLAIEEREFEAGGLNQRLEIHGSGRRINKTSHYRVLLT